MTAVADPPPLAVDEPPRAFTLPVPLATITADLMPAEVRLKRRLAYLKRRLAFVLVALVALVVLGDMLVRQQTSSAQGDLGAANDHIAALNAQLKKFDGVLTTQSETQAIWTQLDSVMGNDVSWLALLNELTKPARPGMHVALTAQIDDPDSTTGSSTAGSTASLVPDQVGTLTLTGSAPTWSDVAAYVHGLSAIKGFAAVNPSSVSHQSGGANTPGGSGGTGVTFTVTLDLTSAALSHRYDAGSGTPVDATRSKPALTFPGDPAHTGRTAAASTVGKARPPAGSSEHHHAGHRSSHSAGRGAAGRRRRRRAEMPRTQTERVWLGGSALLALLIAVVGYFFVVGPQRSRTSDVQTQVAAAQLQATTLQSRIVTLTAEQKKSAAYRAALVRAQAALPTADDLSANPALLRSLQVAAHRSAVSIASLTVGDPTAIAAAAAPTSAPSSSTAASPSATAAADTTPPADLYSVDITTSVSGSTKGLLSFLTRLQYRLPRTLFIGGATIGSEGTSGSSAGSETMSLTMTAFVRPPPTAAATAPATTPTSTTTASP